MRSASIDALLLQPPPGDLSGPYPALPYLKSYAEREGIRTEVRDLGIEALHYLAEENRVEGYVKKAGDLLTNYERRRFLSAAELHHLELLYMAQGLGLKPGLVGRAMKAFQSPGKFYDYALYKKAMRFLDAFFRLLSAVHYPTALTPSQYPTAADLKAMDNVLLHCREELNPYAAFYKDVLFSIIAEQNPAVVGISMVFGSQSVQALVLGRLLKEHFPSIHVTMGGAYLSQWITVMGKTQMTDLFACTDTVICAEGEAAFSELVRCVTQGQALDNVPNLVYRDGASGSIRLPSSLEYTDISNQPAPNFDDLDLRAYLTPQLVIPYCISRGCYWGRCVFCQNRYGDHGMRRYQTVPVEKAVDDLYRLSRKYGSNHFNFNNDVIDPNYLKHFSKALIAAGKNFIWNTDLRAEKAFTAEACRLLSRAGLNSVAIGFESGCQKTLDRMDKGYRLATVRRVMKGMHRAGVATQAMGIFGFPGETEEEANMTIAFLENNLDRISYYVVGLLMVLPGSRMYNHPELFDVSNISFAGNPLRTPEPIWTCRTRISREAASRLYERLGRLEEIFAINEYPYVGGLATNHGFLYFRRFGPDVLKQLRAEERSLHDQHIALLGLNRQPGSNEMMKAVCLQYDCPFTVVASRFALERASFLQDNVEQYAEIKARSEAYYLVDALNRPVQISLFELELLKRMEGETTVATVLGQVPSNMLQRAVYFLFYLLTCGLVVLRQAPTAPASVDATTSGE